MGVSYLGDIAIDDVSLQGGPCPPSCKKRLNVNILYRFKFCTFTAMKRKWYKSKTHLNNGHNSCSYKFIQIVSALVEVFSHISWL